MVLAKAVVIYKTDWARKIEHILPQNIFFLSINFKECLSNIQGFPKKTPDSQKMKNMPLIFAIVSVVIEGR